MNTNKLITLLKDKAVENMTSYNILASVQIASAIILSNNASSDSSKERNDLYNFSEQPKFESIEDSLQFYCENGAIHDCVGVKDYKKACEIVSENDNGIMNRLIGVIEKYNLYEYDTIATQTMDDVIATSVDISITEDDKPIVESYSVRENADDIVHVRYTSNSKQSAIENCRKYPGCSVFDSKNNVIYAEPAIVKEDEKKPRIKKVVFTGMPVNLTYVPLYSTVQESKYVKTLSGKYYINSEKKTNERYKVSETKNHCGTKKFIGYIDANFVE